MPITRSAKKAKRSADRKRSFNLTRKSKIDKAVKQVKKLVADKKKKEANAALASAQKALDKAAKMGTLTANAASRKKSRLSAMVRKIEK